MYGITNVLLGSILIAVGYLGTMLMQSYMHVVDVTYIVGGLGGIFYVVYMIGECGAGCHQRLFCFCDNHSPAPIYV